MRNNHATPTIRLASALKPMLTRQLYASAQFPLQANSASIEKCLQLHTERAQLYQKYAQTRQAINHQYRSAGERIRQTTLQGLQRAKSLAQLNNTRNKQLIKLEKLYQKQLRVINNKLQLARTKQRAIKPGWRATLQALFIKLTQF